MDFTKKGHKLEWTEGLVFQCKAHALNASGKAVYPTVFVLSSLAVWTPCTRATVVTTLRAWLTAYDDAELLEQVGSVVDDAIKSLPEPPAMPPAAPGSGPPPDGENVN